MTLDAETLDEYVEEFGEQVVYEMLEFREMAFVELVVPSHSHPAQLGYGEWWACSRSETRIDYHAKVDTGCRGCLVAYFAWLITADPRYQPTCARLNEDGVITGYLSQSRETWEGIAAQAAIEHGITDLPLWPRDR